MYGVEITDVNDFGGWVGYEPVREDVARTLNHHMYLLFQNEYRINQFVEDRKLVINVKDNSPEKVVGNARTLKVIVGYSTLLSMSGYKISVPTYVRSIVKLLSGVTGFIPESTIYTFSDAHYEDMKTDFNSISDLMTRTSIEAVDILLGNISFMNKDLLYHYPHYSIISGSRVKMLDDDYQAGS